MARQKTSRKSSPKNPIKASSKRNSASKGPRKSRFSLPSSASESQKTLTQLHFVPSFGEPEEVDLEYLEPIGTGSQGEDLVKIARPTPVPRSTAKPHRMPASKSTQKRKAKLQKNPGDRTLTQIGYVARYQVKSIEDDEEIMEYLRHDDPPDARTDNGQHDSDPLSDKSESEQIRVDKRSTSLSKRHEGRSRNTKQDHEKENTKRKVRGKRSRLANEIANHLASPEKPELNGHGKRKASFEDVSGDAEADYADDESPKRRKRQCVSPDSQAPVASRLRPRRAHVSYFGGQVTKDLNCPKRKNNVSKRVRKNTRSVSVVSKQETPIKTRVAEIPSSESPGSTPLSIRSRPPTRSGEISPLRSPLTDLSAYSRLANSAKFQRSNEKSNTNLTPSGPRNMIFRNIPTDEGVAPTNNTDEDDGLARRGQGSVGSSCPNSSLPDIATIFGSSLASTKPKAVLIINGVAANEPSQDSYDEFEMGIETQVAIDQLGHSSPPQKGDGFSSQHASQELPISITSTPMQNSKGKDLSARFQSDSPPWISNAIFESARHPEFSKELRQSQISTQGVSQSSDPPAAQAPPRDLTQIWDSTDSTSSQRQQPKCPIRPSHSEAIGPKSTASQQPRDLTQIWDSTNSTSSHPNSGKSTTSRGNNSPPKSTWPSAQSASSPPESQARPNDVTQIWDSDSSQGEFWTASQLLPASMLESLPKPPAWTQQSLSDEEWI